MDDRAFVESLFAPEMRPAVGSSSLVPSVPSCGRVRALVAERTVVVPTSLESAPLVPPPPHSLVGGGLVAYQVPFPPLPDDTPLFVRHYEDGTFGQMLHEQDVYDVHGLKQDSHASATRVQVEPLPLARHKDPVAAAPKQGSCQTLPVPLPLLVPRSSDMQRTPTAAPLSPGHGLDSPLMPEVPLGGCHWYDGNDGYPTVSTPPAWVQEAPEATVLESLALPLTHAGKPAVATDSLMLPYYPSPGAVDTLPLALRTQPHATFRIWLSMLPPPSATCATNRPTFPSSPTHLIVSADCNALPPATRAKRSRTQAARPLAAASGTASRPGPARASGTVAKGKKCVEPACLRRAQSKRRCKAHGGGARCQYTGPGGCSRSSQGGGFCRAHGGGKRCEFPHCPRGQQRKGRCYVHGGIRKCHVDTCEKKDRGNGFCIAHGGGKRCTLGGCTRAVRRGRLCQVHEGGTSKEDHLMV